MDQVSFFMGYILIWSSRWHPTPVLLPGKSHGRRSLVGCSPWDRKDSDTTERLHFQFSLFTFIHWRRKWQTHSSVLAWRIPGTGEPGGLPSMGSHRVGHNWSDLAAAAAAASTGYRAMCSETWNIWVSMLLKTETFKNTHIKVFQIRYQWLNKSSYLKILCVIATSHLWQFNWIFVFILFIYLFLAMLHSLWDINSPTRNQTQGPRQWEHQVLTTELPGIYINWIFVYTLETFIENFQTLKPNSMQSSLGMNTCQVLQY